MKSNVNHDVANDEIDLKELFQELWRRKFLIILITTLFTGSAVFYAVSLPDFYKSEVLLAQAIDNDGLKIPGQIGSLAALAGMNIGSGNQTSNQQIAIEILKSRKFISEFISKNQLLTDLMAVQSWDRANNKFSYDPEIYNSEDSTWVRKVSLPFMPKPSLQESYDKFMQYFLVVEDSKTGLVKVSFEHYSPYFSKKIVDLLVAEINNEMRERALVEANKSIDYLNKQLAATNISELKTMLFSLIEEQTKKVVLANARDEYAFRIIDEAIVPEKKSKPKRLLIVIAALFAGLFFSVFALIVRKFFLASDDLSK